MTERTSFLAELKRRNVIRVAIAYVAVSWLVLQVGSLIVQVLELPNAVSKAVFVVLVIGFIPALVFSWIYELTPEGLKRESEIERDESITRLTGRKLDYLVIGVLAAVVVLLLVDRFVLLPRHAAKVAASQPAESPAPTTAAPAKPAQASIAVLPFADMSQDKDQEYLSDGISEELLNLLARVTKLHVAARTSSFSFKGKEVAIPEIAKTLRVAHVLEGSVRKAGDQVRITAQLIRAEDGYHLWSRTYDRKLDDIFKIQDEIAADVVKELKVTLLGEAPKARETDPEAYGLYLQALDLGRKNTLEAIEKSDALYRQALERDSRYAPAWVGLSRNAANSGSLGSDQQGALAASAEFARKALAVDPDYAPAHGMLASIASTQGDLAGAVPHLERAIALNPTDTSVLNSTATTLGRFGRVREALMVREALARRDPVNSTLLYNLGNTHRLLGQFDAAISTYRTLLALSPERGSTHAALGLTLVLKGDAAAGLAEIEQEKVEVWRSISLPMAYHALGRKADADAAFAALIAKYERDGAFNIAYVCAFRGDVDGAFRWLDKAVESRDSGLGGVASEPLFANVRSDPRWLPFLRKVGQAPEQLAEIKFELKLPPELK